MKKILYITTLSRTINAFLIPHIKMLIDEGNIVDCACNIDKEIDKSLLQKGIKVYNIPFSRNPLDPRNLKALSKLITIQKENNYDIVHVHTPIAALYGRLLKLKYKSLKTIYTVHGFHFYKGAPLINWVIYYPIERMMAKLTDTIITINSEDYERALKFKIPDTYKVNGVGVDLSIYNNDLLDKEAARWNLGISKDDFVILMIAEVNVNKNHKQLIEAIDILKKRKIKVKVLCAGDGPLMNKVTEQIGNRNLEDCIIMLGFRTDIIELITACDIGILLSYREGLPKNIMEIMAFGKKVIATDIRGNRDLVCNENVGTLVDVGDYAATAEAIEYYYINNNNRENIISKEIEIYDVKRVLKELKGIYQGI